MKREVGVWIDHHKTVMVSMVDEKEETREIRSNIEKHLDLSGRTPGKKPNASKMSTAKDESDHRYGDHLSAYYDGVISLLRSADSIWIYGPGEAEIELKKRLERDDLGSRVISVETVNKLTDRQIMAKLRQHFQQ